MSGSSATISELGAWLLARAPFWQDRPFTGVVPAWARSGDGADEALHRWILDAANEGEASVERLHRTLLEGLPPPQAPSRWIELTREAARACAWLGGAPRSGAARPGSRIPIRKQHEVEGFARSLAGALPDVHQGAWVADWCSGKGHLGRSIAITSRAGLWALDCDAVLLSEAAQLAEASGIPVATARLDLLHDPVPDAPGPLSAVVGLHACGHLGHRLLSFAVAHQAPVIALAPCCLHRHHPQSGWPTLSASAAATGLSLDHAALRLATADETVARPSRRHRRRRSEAWRLAVDLLLREHHQRDAHHALGTLPAAWFEGDFIPFARVLGSHLGVPMGPDSTLAAALAEGTRRALIARALGAVRAIFRRPIELFTALDRAAFLEEQGWRAVVSTFCPAEVTPRNLLVLASR